MLIYTGIGSRSTPDNIIRGMVWLGERLGSLGFTLRSGAAPGADSAFEKGCDRVEGAKEIYLPWPRFEDHGSSLFTPSPEAREYASAIHPNWMQLSHGAKSLHARNVHQSLGLNLNTHSMFVAYWAREYGGRVEGGTRTAVQAARDHNIPTFNLGSPDSVHALGELLEAEVPGTSELIESILLPMLIDF